MIPALSDNEGQPFKQIAFAGAAFAGEGGAVSPQQGCTPPIHDARRDMPDALAAASDFLSFHEAENSDG